MTEQEREQILIKKVMKILKNDNHETAREIIVEIGSLYEGFACVDLTQELRLQSEQINYYVDLVHKLEGKITELELSSGYRKGYTDVIKNMPVGGLKFFPCGDQFNKVRKRLWNIAKAAGIKIKTRAIQKNGSIGVEVTRLT